MGRLLFFFLMVLITTTTVFAKYVSDPLWEFKIDIPNNWKYQKQGTGLLLGSNTIPGLIIIMPNNLNKNQLRLEMQKGINQNSFYLQLKGNLKNIKDGFYGKYTGTYNGGIIKGIAFGKSKNSSGVVILAISTPDKFGKKLINSINYLGKHVKFISQNNKNSMISSHFVGVWKHLTKNTETTVVLNANGRYTYNYSSSYSGAGWGTTNGSDDSGSWKIKGNRKKGVLILTDKNGGVSYYKYVMNGNHYKEYYFNGVFYFKK